MKLTCEMCHAKYSIADERIAGKVFKIRCKKCSHVLIVRATSSPTTIDEWHAVIDGAQCGPFDRAELARRRDAREIGDDTLVWREGMPDWAALGKLDAVQPPAAAAVDVPEAMPLRNERNETSVLFTLGTLARLAQPAQPAAATPAASPGEEGSGLIDIRALASAWARPSATATPVTGTLDELPLYATTSIADPIVLVPTASRGIDRRLLVALVAMLAMIAALATVLVVVLTRDGGTAQAAVPAPPVDTPVKAEPPPPVAPPEAAPAAPVEVAAPPVAPVKPRRPPKSAKVTPPPAAAETCSEVSCMVNDNAGNCCDQFRSRKPATPPPGELPDNLDRAALAKGIATINAQRCGAASAAKGDVSVSVKVTAEGTVSGVTVKSTPDQALAACVVAEAKRGTFAKTKRGGSFAYFWRF